MVKIMMCCDSPCKKVVINNGKPITSQQAKVLNAADDLLAALSVVMDKYSNHLDGFVFEQCHQAISKATN